LVYETFIGPIPENLVIDHLCRNRACQNPFHLEPVTPEENTKRGARATMTHCKNGHPFSGLNLVFSSSGSRICRICRNAYQAQHQKAVGRRYQTDYRARRKGERKSDSATRS
jgi:hypothetical protein